MFRIREEQAENLCRCEAFSVRVRRLNINRTYTPLKIGVVAGYILLGMLSASSSMFGIIVGAMVRLAGF